MNSDFLSVLLTSGFVLIVLFWFVRFFVEMGVSTERYGFLKFFSCKNKPEGEKLTRDNIIRVFLFALGVRLVIYVASVLVSLMISQTYSQQASFTFSDFLSSWQQWDARHYISLAKLGYNDYVEDGQHLFLVFFPMYPWVMRLFHIVIRDWNLCALVVSTLAFCVGSVFFFGAIKEEYGNRIAKKSLVLLCAYPFAFFFGGVMTESLFFCFISAGFFFIRRHNWFAAGIIGIFCSLCRVQGIILFGVGMLEFFVYYKPVTMAKEHEFTKFIKLFFTKAIWLFLMFIGNIIYLFINYQMEGNPFQFNVYQREHWYHNTTWFTNVVSEIKGYISAEDASGLSAANMKMSIWYPEIIVFALAAVLIIYSLKTHPLKYSAFLIVYTIVNYSVTFLISGGRYMLCALPMFIILAELTEREKSGMLYRLIGFTGLILQGIYFVGFMTGQQIM